MDKSKIINRIIVIISVMVAMLLVSVAVTGCAKSEKLSTYIVAVSTDEGCEIEGNFSKRVNLGGGASFPYKLRNGYKLVSVLGGIAENGEIKVENVTRTLTVVVRTKKIAQVETDTSNCEIKIDYSDNEKLEGLAATLIVTPFENYYIDSLTLNGEKIEKQADVSGKIVYDFTLQESNTITAIALGKQLSFTLESELLTATINGVEAGDIVHYDDSVTINAPQLNGTDEFGYITVNGEIHKDYRITIILKEDTSVQVRYRNKNSRFVSYSANGGKVISEVNVEFYDIGDRVFLDNLYDTNTKTNKYLREGYTLTEYNTKADGSGEAHSLGAMILMPNEDLTLYAIWEKQTDASAFDYNETDSGIEIEGMNDTTIEKIVIPEFIEGKPVTTIKANAFAACKTTTEIITNNQIRTLETNAFKDCSALETVLLYDSMTTVGTSFFDGTNLHRMLYNDTKGASHTDYTADIAEIILRIKNKERDPAVIVISGSSGKYGVDIPTIKKQLNMDTYVIGIIAQMNIPWLYELVAVSVKEGDIVILSHEVEHFYLKNQWINNNDTFYYRHLWANVDLFRDFDHKRDNNDFDLLIDGMRRRVAGISPYPYAITNEYGVLRDPTAYKDNSEKNFANSVVDYRYMLNNENIATEVIQVAADKIKKAGAKTYLSFPAHYKREMTSAEQQQYEMDRAEFLEFVKQKIGSIMPVISDPKDYELPLDYMYDTIWHPTTYRIDGEIDGAKLRTTQLCEDIQAQLKKEQG